MNEVNLMDLADLSVIKSSLLTTIYMLETDNGCTKEEAATDLRGAMKKLMKLEEDLQESFSEETSLKMKNRPNAVTLASTRRAIRRAIINS